LCRLPILDISLNRTLCGLNKRVSSGSHSTIGSSFFISESPTLSPESQIRERVLRALALNRTPGYHFIGNFLDFSFDHVSEPDVRMSMDAGPHIIEADDNVKS
jgi:hypothetical protein